MGQRLFHLINQNQTKIARAQTPQGGIDRAKFSLNLVNPPGSPRAVQALAKQCQDFAVSTSALTGILVEDNVIKGLSKDPRLITEIDIASIAGATDDDRTASCGYRFNGLNQGDHRIRIVAIVGNDGCPSVI
jgi:hypothetical protein